MAPNAATKLDVEYLKIDLWYYFQPDRFCNW
jgi:hypothetical protein